MTSKSTDRKPKTDPQKWPQLKSILTQALEETSSAEQTRSIRKQCAGDSELLREAEALLAETNALLAQPS